MQFPTETMDTNSEFANNVFTSKSVQTINVSASIAITSAIGNGQYLYIFVYKNGVQIAKNFDITSNNAASVNISIPVQVAVNETIEIYCQHTNGTNNRNLDGSQYLNIKQMY